MLPVGPMMIEHRLIERMIKVVDNRMKYFEDNKTIDAGFIDQVVDFIRTYADRCHHGKEENILFRELGKKRLSAEHRRIMNELIEEHRQGRKAVGELVSAKEKYIGGDKKELSTIFKCLRFLVNFYPKHIEKEDKHFFLPCMNYFSAEEQGLMLKEGWEFDKNLIHQIYRQKVEQAERK